MSAADIYANELLKKKLGFPLWEPDPGADPDVQIADVGYIHRGAAFVRLFNSSKAEDDPDNARGVPLPYTPLNVGRVRRDNPLPLGTIRSDSVKGGTVGVELQAGPLVGVGGGISFSCEKQKGAALLLGDLGYCEEALQVKHFFEYARTHMQSWLTFANNDENGYGIALDDLIFVTGSVKTSAWACAAFSEVSHDSSVTFQAGPTMVQGRLVWGTWAASYSADKHSGPMRLIPPETSDLSLLPRSATGTVTLPGTQTLTAPPPSNQCVFLRGFKCCDRFTYLLRKARFSNTVGDGFKSVSPSIVPTSRTTSERSVESKSPNSLTQSSSLPSDQMTPEGSTNSSNRPALLHDIEALDGLEDDEVQQFIELNSDKEPSMLDHLLYYIMEVSQARLAIIHTDDLHALLPDNTDVTDFDQWLHDLAPKVYVDEDNVGMFEVAYHRIKSESGEKEIHTDPVADKGEIISIPSVATQQMPQAQPQNLDANPVPGPNHSMHQGPNPNTKRPLLERLSQMTVAQLQILAEHDPTMRPTVQMALQQHQQRRQAQVQAAQSSLRAPKSSLKKAASKARPQRESHASKTTRPPPQPEAGPSNRPTLKRPREEALPQAQDAILQPADSGTGEPSPKRVQRADWDGPSSEELEKRRQEREEIQTEQDVQSFTRATEDFLMSGNGDGADGPQDRLPLDLRDLFKGTPIFELPDIFPVQSSSDLAPGGSASSKLSGVALENSILDFFDFAQSAPDEPVPSSSTLDTPGLVHGSSANSSPETALAPTPKGDHAVVGSSMAKDAKKIEEIVASNRLAFDAWAEINEGESAFSGPEWNWEPEGEIPVDEPWAIARSPET